MLDIGAATINEINTIESKPHALKHYLLTDRQDQVAHALVHKLLAYALGRPLTLGDQAEIDRVTALSRRQDDRLGDLIHLIVSSSLFNSR